MHAALASASWFGGHPPGVVLVGLGFLVIASSLVFETSPRRPLQYPFAFGALALFLIVGTFAACIVFVATLAGMLLRALAHRRDAQAASGAGSAAALGVVGAAIIVGIAVGSLLARLLHLGYPLPIGGARGPGYFVLVVCAAFITFVTAKELGASLLARRSGVPAPRSRDRVGVYAAGLIVGLPMQLAAHAVYLGGHLAPWALALSWALLINVVIGRQLERMRRTAALMEELARKERMAAIGEVTARVLHHTRHQMGLVGMIAHQIMRRLERLPPAEASAIGEELAKLKAVQEDLQQALTVDTGDDVPRAIERDEAVYRPPYEMLIRTQSARLEPLAAERAVAVELAVAGDVPAGLAPKSPVKLGHAFSNVLENAISAAAGRVMVGLVRDGPWVVISVADDGPGMTDDFIARATEPFVTTKNQGSGMGLAITRAVVEEEEGALEIANRPEGGLVVSLRLPVRPGGAHDSIS
ncbi:MAG: ATP-binding protein [Polyangia bacterium]